ncbi:MAG: phosphoribosylformylglycinamidine synthase subunit PurL [Candidatus Bathyarchaeia archaeon]
MRVGTSLKPEEMDYIIGQLCREPNRVELGMLELMYSEHCSYKSSRPILRILPKEGPRVLVGPGYDAGIVDIGNGYVVAFKIESHNHPSAIDPYNGAATGIGGIVRDILCTNCRPVALLDSLRFGPPRKGRTKWLLKYVVKGISDYGNRIGVPTIAGEVEFDESFETNCLVNVACVGIGRRDSIVLAKMERPGDYIVLMGSSTGRDGIHGVTFASKTITAESEEERPSVQIGDPFMKKMIIEATLEAVATGFITGLKDLGGAGLTCALSEMSFKGGTGVEVDLEKVHLREEGMTPYEIMLSESQERMLFVVKPEGLEKVLEVFRKWGLPYSVIGKVTDTGEVLVRHRGEVVARLPSKLLAETPILRRRAKRPKDLPKMLKVPKPREPRDLGRVLVKMLSSPNIASKEPIYSQYDYEVGVRTIVKPGDGDAAVLRLLEEPRAIAVKADCNSRHCRLDPFNGHAGAVAESARNVVAVGAEPIAAVDCCNFGNPERPEVFWQFVEGIRGLSYMLEGLGIPCVGGNVSFYNEDERTGRAVNPTTVVVTLGLVEELDWVTTMAFKEHGDEIFVVGRTYAEMGGSEYYHWIHGISGGKPPRASPERERASMAVVKDAIRGGLIDAAHDCSKGGIAVALAVMAMKGGLGADVDLGRIPRSGVERLDELLFSESYARFIISAQPGAARELRAIAERHGCALSRLGRVIDSPELSMRHGEREIRCGLGELMEAWKGSMRRYLGEL